MYSPLPPMNDGGISVQLPSLNIKKEISRKKPDLWYGRVFDTEERDIPVVTYAERIKIQFTKFQFCIKPFKLCMPL